MDAELQTILDQSRLGYLPEREGGWDTKKVWKDVLSGGEKQRMQIARLLYHEPKYAFIDEGTSAVSSDVEGLLYETCKNVGISESLCIRLICTECFANHTRSPCNHLHKSITETLSRLYSYTRSWRRCNWL